MLTPNNTGLEVSEHVSLWPYLLIKDLKDFKKQTINHHNAIFGLIVKGIQKLGYGFQGLERDKYRNVKSEEQKAMHFSGEKENENHKHF